MRGQKMTLQPDKHNWGFHPQTPKVYRFWVSGKGDTTSSDVIYATESIGRQLWPGLAGNYGPAGRGKRLYAFVGVCVTEPVTWVFMTVFLLIVYSFKTKKLLHDRVVWTA